MNEFYNLKGLRHGEWLVVERWVRELEQRKDKERK